MDAAPPTEPRPRGRLLWLLLLPALVVPWLLPARRFLPQLPVMFEPLASEHPELAARAWGEANLVASDGLFPLLSDEREVRAQLGRGELPLWDARAGRGAPLAAGSMAAPWNPLRWPFLWMSASRARGWHALLSWVLVGLWTLLFLERRVPSSCALVGALTAQGAGFVYANLHLLPKLDAALWLPLVLWGLEGALLSGSRRGALAATLGLAGSALAGFPPIFVFVLLASAAWFGLNARGAPRRRLAWTLGVLASGVAMGAVHLAPMARLALSSTRGGQDLERVAAQALPAEALLGLVSPEALGTPREPRGPLGTNPLEGSIFVGGLALLLALAAVGLRGREVLFPAALLLVVLGFQFGVPGIRWLYALPGLDLGAPARAGALAPFGWAWLAATGASLLRGRALQFITLLLVATTSFFAARPWARGVHVDEAMGVFPESPAMRRIAEVTGAGALVRVDSSASGVEEVVRLARPNLPSCYGVRDLTPYVALPDGELVARLREHDPGGTYRSGWSALSEPQLAAGPWLDELGVTCVMATSRLDVPGLEEVAVAGGVHVHSRPSGARALPDTSRPTSELTTFWLSAALSLLALLSALALLRRAETD